MHEWNSEESRQREEGDLERRLAAYYGPDLREHPLPQSAWSRVEANLGPQQSARRIPGHINVRTIFRRRSIRSRRVPVYIQDAFLHVVHEARVQGQPPVLHCSLKERTRVPAVYNAFLGRRAIKLVLPPNAVASMEGAALDVLLATGLARYSCIRKLEYLVPRFLLVGVVLLACVTLILYAAYNYSLLPFLIAILLCAIVAGLVSIQRRRLAFRADKLMVRWLGRSRVCKGLHILAGRSRTRWRRIWGEPTLAERIDRLCGTRVEIEDERLTLVR
jgi:hypothetical protein